MSKRVAIVQSNYIPWKGYFDLISSVDEFILYDDMQYTRRDWRNRNRIKTQKGATWLTIPVEVRGKYFQSIKDTMISDPGWNQRHWDTIVRSYGRAPCFRAHRETFERLYLDCREQHLSAINHRFLTAICHILGIQTKISWSMDYRLSEGKTERLVDLCRQAGATEYISGPSARGYIDETLFRNERIELSYIDYNDYPEYNQLFPPFVHEVSVLDLLFNTGKDACHFLKSSSL